MAQEEVKYRLVSVEKPDWPNCMYEIQDRTAVNRWFCINSKNHGGKHSFTDSAPKLFDVVNHPSHYTFGTIEVIDAIEDWQLGFHLGNAVKYIARAGRKDPSKIVEDLEKARWYLDRYIKSLKKE